MDPGRLFRPAAGAQQPRTSDAAPASSSSLLSGALRVPMTASGAPVVSKVGAALAPGAVTRQRMSTALAAAAAAPAPFIIGTSAARRPGQTQARALSPPAAARAR
eukprot:tig00000310_g23947.t1